MSRWWLLVLPALALGTFLPEAGADDKLDRFNAAVKEIKEKEQQGDLEGARVRCRQAAQAAAQDFGEAHFRTADLVNFLGFLHLASGQFAEAEEQFDKALKLRQKATPYNPAAEAQSRNNLGELYRRTDDYAKAEKHLQAALGVLQEALKTANEKTRPVLRDRLAEARINLGKTYEMMGQFVEAARQYAQCLKDLPDEPRYALGRATALNNQAWLNHSRGRLDEVEAPLRKALEIRRTQLGDASPAVAECLNNLGMLFHSQKNYAESERHFTNALKTLKGDSMTVATVENNLACLYRSLGKHEEARDHLTRASDLLVRLGRDDLPEMAACRINRAWLDISANRPAAASEQMDLVRRSLRLHAARVLAAQSETEQLAFLRNKEQRWLSAALSIGLLSRNEPEQARLSTTWLLNAKAVGLQTIAQRTLESRKNDNPDAERVRKELLQVRAGLAALSHVVPASGQEAKHTKTWADLSERERELSRKLGHAIGVGSAAWVELDAVRKELPADAVLVEIVRFEEADFKAAGTDWRRKPPRLVYAAWVIPARGQVRIVPLGEAAPIEAAVKAYQKELQAFLRLLKKQGRLKTAEETASEKKFMAPLQDLSRLVLKPLGIENSRQWIISPDALLWQVPWAALPVDGKFAIEDHPISLLATGRDLTAKPAEVTASDPVIFANVKYGALSEKNPPRLGFTFLEWSLGEAQAAKPKIQQYAGREPKLLTEDKATETAFRALRNPKVLMLSTHGFFRPDSTVDLQNPLLQCGLAFADANRRNRPNLPAAGDGILFGLEILEVDLRGTDLVVLSACDTALGEVREGEGVISLQYAFQLAGARSVVAALWEVPDEQTAYITRDFFEQLAAKGDKAEALRQAQLARIKERRDLEESTHPFFWSALTLTGHWK